MVLRRGFCVRIGCKRGIRVNGWDLRWKLDLDIEKDRVRCGCGWFMELWYVCDVCGIMKKGNFVCCVKKDDRCWEESVNDYYFEMGRLYRNRSKVKECIVIGGIMFGLFWGFGGWWLWEMIKDMIWWW